MRRKLAQWTEWAWSHDLLSDELARARFVQAVWTWLAMTHGQKIRLGSENHLRGLAQISSDVDQILRTLRYGGRSPSDILPARKEKLNQSIPIFAGALHRASTLSNLKESATLRL